MLGMFAACLRVQLVELRGIEPLTSAVRLLRYLKKRQKTYVFLQRK